MYRSIAVMPLQPWMMYYVDEEDGREENRYPPYQPIMHRDGWFWDRIAKREWYEYSGQAFLISNNGGQFRYELGLANTRVLSAREVRAYQEILRTRPPKAIRVRIQEALASDAEVKFLAGIRRDALRISRRFRLRLQQARAASQSNNS
jgi:hypothetical protein